MKKGLLILMILISSLSVAQDKMPIETSDYNNQEVAMADKFREDGKIYVLTGIIFIILIGTIGYLIGIDRKVSKMEKLLEDKE